MSPDIFSSQSTETPWEWARKRRKVFTSPIKDFLGALVPAIITGVFRYQAGDPGLRIALIVSSIAVGSAFALPQLKTLYWRIRRRGILLDERERKLAEREAAPRVPPPVPAAATPTPAIERPQAEVTFACDATGWARLRVTNAGAGADFSATIQLYGLTAGAVEGRQIYAKWELGDRAMQRLAAGETRTLRIATITQIALGVRGWAVHRADGDDIRGVDVVEFMEIRVVANPDLVDPCHLQILLNADGGSRMTRVGVDQPLFHTVPPRVAHMRRLLAEVVEYLQAMPLGRGYAKAAVWMAVMVHDHVADLLGQAFGPREIAVYGLQVKESGGNMLQFCTGYLLGKAQRLTEDEILPSFQLPITWVQFYERQPGWEWPEYEA